MEYTFVLGLNACIESIEARLRDVVGITWHVEAGNLRVDVPDNLFPTIEEQIFNAVSAGIENSSEQYVNDNNVDSANILCGALQSKLLDKYLPIALSSLPSSVVLEVDSIDDQLVMLRMRGPRESIDAVDRVSAWIMSKCAVGVRDDEQPKTADQPTLPME